MLWYIIQYSFAMFKNIDATPNQGFFKEISSTDLGKSKGANVAPGSHCGCNKSVSTVSTEQIKHTPFTLVADNNAGYYNAINMSPSEYDVFDEIGYGDNNSPNHSKVDLNVTFDYMTHVYISSLAVIGLYALYRIIHRTR